MIILTWESWLWRRNKQEQYIGILGQIVLADILEINRIKGNE